jgi:hypothetical protein
MKKIKKLYFYAKNLIFPIPTNGVSKFQVLATLNKNSFSFDCTKCGKCCYGPGNVYFSQKDCINIKKYLKLNEDQWNQLAQRIFHKNQNGIYIHKTYNKCYFLDDKNRCRIYPIRPLQCRTFPFWPSYFSKLKELENLIHSCPGSKLVDFQKNAKTYSVDEIVYYCNKTIKKFNRSQTSQNKNDLIKL